MDSHIKDYFSQASDEAPHGHFHWVLAVHETPGLKWSDIKEKIPKFCKGWFELAHLPPQDRIEFVHDFWMSKLSYQPHFPEMTNKFFDGLDDIGVYLVQKNFDGPYDAFLVYSQKNGGGFFRGSCGASESDIVNLQRMFPDVVFPRDYISFLQIHNGFSKATDTGILRVDEIKPCFKKFQDLLEMAPEPLTSPKGEIINPHSLIPFYESFGMPVFQCFWTDWYPQDEMGNVYYSDLTHSLSDIDNSDVKTESLGFPTFLDWLSFYLERVE